MNHKSCNLAICAITQLVLNQALLSEIKPKLKFVLKWLFTYYHHVLLRPVCFDNWADSFITSNGNSRLANNYRRVLKKFLTARL
jgi:hypothetical protein